MPNLLEGTNRSETDVSAPEKQVPNEVQKYFAVIKLGGVRVSVVEALMIEYLAECLSMGVARLLQMAVQVQVTALDLRDRDSQCRTGGGT